MPLAFRLVKPKKRKGYRSENALLYPKRRFHSGSVQALKPGMACLTAIHSPVIHLLELIAALWIDEKISEVGEEVQPIIRLYRE